MTTTDSELAAIFLASSRNALFNQYWPRLKACVEPMSVEQIWWRPNDASNSVGNLILHLNGNVSQWIVNSFNRGEDRRDRPAEFSAAGGLAASELLTGLGDTLTEVAKVLDRLTVDELIAPREIQGYKTCGLDAVYHVVDHFALHFGQIAYITKSLTARDLGFYKELNKTGRAS